MIDEIWLPVVGFEKFYEMSNKGNVRSLDRTVGYYCLNRLCYRSYYGQPIKARAYYIDGRLKRMNICLTKEGTKSHRVVHHLVMEAFVGPRPEGQEVCHNDSDPSNNRLENLRYDTHINNCNDRRENGTELIGSRNPAAILDEAKVVEIRKKSDLNARQVAKLYGVSHHCIHDLRRGRTWQHVV